MSGNNSSIFTAWNDNGSDALIQLKAYYAIQRGILVVAARAWSGTYNPSYNNAILSDLVNIVSSKTLGQNLNRRLSSNGCIFGLIFLWIR